MYQAHTISEPTWLAGDKTYGCYSYIASVDLGQTTDYTAYTLLRVAEASKKVDHNKGGWFYERNIPQEKRAFEVLDLYRFPLSTSYPNIVEAVTERLSGLRGHLIGKGHVEDSHVANLYLAIDGSGVGRSVVDLFRQSRIAVPLVPVTITAGDKANFDGKSGYWRVPKAELIGFLQVLLQSNRLRIAEGLPEADTIRKELLNYRKKTTPAGNTQFDVWREGTHDDLLLSLAIGAFSTKIIERNRRGAKFVREIKAAWQD